MFAATDTVMNGTDPNALLFFVFAIGVIVLIGAAINWFLGFAGREAKRKALRKDTKRMIARMK